MTIKMRIVGLLLGLLWAVLFQLIYSFPDQENVVYRAIEATWNFGPLGGFVVVLGGSVVTGIPFLISAFLFLMAFIPESDGSGGMWL